MTLKTERRTRLRKRPLSLVYVELPPSNGGMMRDLSEEGFSLRAMMPLQQSEKVPFSFQLDAAAPIDGEAIVVRAEDNGHVAVLEFAGLPSHARDQIRRWLDRLDEPISKEPAPDQPTSSKHSSLTELRSQIRAPKPPPSGPPAAESPAAPPPKVTVPQKRWPPTPEPAPMPPSPAAEIAPAEPKAPEPPRPESLPGAVLPTVESTVPPVVAALPKPEQPTPPVAEIPQPPLHTVMTLPKSSSLPSEEAPPPPTLHSSFDQPEAPALPPLLKLSSVRPGPQPKEISAEPVAAVTIPKPAAEPPARIQIISPKRETPSATESRVPEPAPVSPVAPRRVPPPPLEPLSSLEGETDSELPRWMDRFTLGRAIGIMLFLTLLAGSYVYHRELGQALIWLGHEIAGDDSSESSAPSRPEIPSASHAAPQPTPAARPVQPPPSVPQSSASSEPKSANLPSARDKTPSPEVKDSTPGSLVPLTQVTRAPASAPPVDNSVEAGQREYLEALQILRSPSRASEVPAAVQRLWAAVEKGNTGAEIALAELFRSGRGVARNCDQARILLSTAARKGSVEARKRLEALRREGCGN